MFACLIVVVYFRYIYAQENDCSSNPFYVYHDNQVHSDTPRVLSVTTNRSELLYAPKFSDKHFTIFHIVPQKGGKEFVICTAPKSGSTRMLFLLKRLKQQTKFKNYNKTMFGLHANLHHYYNPIEWKSPEYIEKVLNNKNIPRFAIVRDPYVRAVSLYQDKVKNSGSIFRGGDNGSADKKIGFDEFVETLYNRVFLQQVDIKGKRIDRHFVSQSRTCGFQDGMKYNYILKQEEIDNWFDCFIDELGARDLAMHGWPGDDECYLSTTQTPCNGPRVKNGTMENPDAKSACHFRGSEKVYKEFYSNQTIVAMVAEIFKGDIFNFDYNFL